MLKYGFILVIASFIFLMFALIYVGPGDNDNTHKNHGNGDRGSGNYGSDNRSSENGDGEGMMFIDDGSDLQDYSVMRSEMLWPPLYGERSYVL